MRRALAAAVLALALTGCGNLSDYMPELPEISMVQVPGGGVPEIVDRVADGDTIDVVPGPGGNVRILGLDSPETVDPRKPVQCWGPEASAWAKAELPRGTEVLLISDETQDAVDRYDRRLAYVEYRRPGSESWVDFSAEAIRLGYARVYVYNDEPVTRYAEYKVLEDNARKARLGLWNCPENLG